MKFLADMGVSLKTVEALRNASHDIVHLRDIGWQKKPDKEIIERARIEERVLLTFDLDFGTLLASSKDQWPSTVIFRLSDQTPDSVTKKLLTIMESQSEFLNEGCIIIVEDNKFRVRKLPL